MGFGGHVQDMISRIKLNREQRPSKRTKFKGDNRETMYSADKKTGRLNFKTLPENELDEIKKQIRERAKAKHKRDLQVFGIIILITLITCIRLLK